MAESKKPKDLAQWLFYMNYWPFAPNNRTFVETCLFYQSIYDDIDDADFTISKQNVYLPSL
jgi:hypothetical protein